MTSPKDAVETKAGRYYTFNGDQYLSVTNALSVINKPALVPSARKVQAEVILENIPHYLRLLLEDGFDTARMQASRDAKARWDTKTDLGSLVHAAVENVCAGQPITEQDPQALPFLEQFQLAIKELGNPTYSEVTVYNRTHGYAGTVDLIFDDLLVDIKTGGVWPEHAIQLAAYRQGEFIGRDGKEFPMPTITNCAVLDLKPDRYTIVPMNTDHLVFDAFLACLELHRWSHQ